MELIKLPARLANSHLFSPETQGFNKGKYGATVVVQKDDAEKINAAIDAEIKNKWGDNQPINLKRPLKDGSPWGVNAILQDTCYLEAYGKFQPKVVGRNVQPIQQNTEFAGGCRCNVVLSFSTYEVDDNVGVTCYLGAVQFVKNDPWTRKKRDITEFFDVIPNDE